MIFLGCDIQLLHHFKIFIVHSFYEVRKIFHIQVGDLIFAHFRIVLYHLRCVTASSVSFVLFCSLPKRLPKFLNSLYAVNNAYTLLTIGFKSADRLSKIYYIILLFQYQLRGGSGGQNCLKPYLL